MHPFISPPTPPTCSSLRRLWNFADVWKCGNSERRVLRAESVILLLRLLMKEPGWGASSSERVKAHQLLCIQHLWGGGWGGSVCRVPTPLQGDLIEMLPQVRRKRDESRFNWRTPRGLNQTHLVSRPLPPTTTTAAAAATAGPLQMSCPLQPEGGSRSPHHSLGGGGASDLGDGPPAYSPPPCPPSPHVLYPPTPSYFAETLFCSIF